MVTFTSNDILVNLSNTCAGDADGNNVCVGGESIILNVATVPEPASLALVGLGLLAITWRRRRRG